MFYDLHPKERPYKKHSPPFCLSKMGYEQQKSKFFLSSQWAALPNSLTEDVTLHLIKGSVPGPQHQFHSANTDTPPKNKEKQSIF